MKVSFSAPDLANYDKRIQRRVVNRAISRTTQGTRHKAVTHTEKQLKAKRRDIRERIRHRSRSGLGFVHWSGWSLPLGSFSPRRVTIRGERGKRRGVSVDVKGRRKILHGHFLISSGGRKKVVRRKEKDRFPLQEAHTTGVSAIASNNGFMKPLREYAGDRFADEVSQTLNYLHITGRA